MGSLTIKLLGTSFKINAHEDDHYLQQLLGYYSSIIEKLQNNLPNQEPLQTAILAGILICDELYSQKYSADTIAVSQEQNQLLTHVEDIAQKLIDSINQVL